MGSCQSCLLFFKNNKVANDPNYYDVESISDSEYYTERVTRIVADIHELTRYKVQHKVTLFEEKI